MIRHGTVSIVDHKKARVKVSLDDRGTQSEWLKVLQGRTKGTQNYSMPRVGEVGLMIQMDNGSNGYYMGAGYSDINFPASSSVGEGKTATIFSDGTTIMYDEKSSKLYIDCKKDIEIICPQITITGDIKVAGNIEVTGGITTTKDIIAGGISLINHTHNYKPGPGGPTPTDKPK